MSTPSKRKHPTITLDLAEETEATLMDVVLGVPDVGSRVLPEHGLLELGRLSPVALAEWAHVSLPAARRLAAAFEIGRRHQAALAQPPVRIRSAEDAARFFHPRLATLLHEELWIAALDAQGDLRGTRRICRGAIDRMSLRTRDVLRPALAMGAKKFVMAQNRPSCDPTPTTEDIEWTSAIERAAHVIDLEMTHHVVVTPGDRWMPVLDQRQVGGPCCQP